MTHFSVVKMKPELFKESELVDPREVDARASEDEDEMASFDTMNELTIRAKWTMDGANTLSEAAEMLRSYADYLDKLEEEGWQLRDGVNDDWYVVG